MLMISNKNKGVTLMVLVITIVVLLILIGISYEYGVTEMHEVSNKKMEAELEIVQEAIMQRYALIKSSNQVGVVAPQISSNASITSETEKNRPDRLVGTRIASSSEISNQGFGNVTPIISYSANESNRKFEEYYYLLDENDLSDLGIEKGRNPNEDDNDSVKKRSYIVNYLTGEVFDVGNKKYYKTDLNGESENLVYKQPTNITMNDKNYNFSDD